MSRITTLAALFCLLISLANCNAQDYSESDLHSDQIIKLTLSPASLPDTARPYQLFPRQDDLLDRNAAIFYHRAVYLFDTTEARLRGQANDPQSVGYSNDFTNETLSPEVLTKLRNWLAVYEPDRLFSEIGYASRSSECDWQIIPEEARDEWFLRLIPEVQSCRSLARFLAAKARVEIIDGNYEEACQTIKTGFRLGADLQKTEILVGSLVGIACVNIMRQPMLELVQKNDCPNLYWSLATIPDSITNVNDSIRAELSLLRQGSGFDLLENPERGRTDKEWRAAMNEYGDRMVLISMMTGVAQVMPPTIVRAYPIAKQFLINQGRTPEEVEAMNSIQVVAIASNAFTNQLVDKYERGLALPPAEANKYFAEIERQDSIRDANGNTVSDLPLLWHLNNLLPAVFSVSSNESRCQRSLLAIQIVEAIRLHLAETGELPESLDAIKVVSLPNNSFRYVRDGETAKLFDFGLTVTHARIYEITQSGK